MVLRTLGKLAVLAALVSAGGCCAFADRWCPDRHSSASQNCCTPCCCCPPTANYPTQSAPQGNWSQPRGYCSCP